MEKHHYTGILGIIVGVIIAIGLVFYFKNLGVKTLYIGEKPNNAQDTNNVKESTDSEKQRDGSMGDEEKIKSDVVVNAPVKDGLVYSPLAIKGLARGPWFFEGVLPVKLLDSNGKLVASGNVTAVGDAMTEGFVPFEGSLVFEGTQMGTGKLVIQASNPSGLPENDKSFELPIRFE
jgi:hypothetical protein